MSLQLTILNGAGKGIKLQLKPGSNLVVGRGDDCDLQIADESVSRVHCYISMLDQTPSIRDANSVNGIFVNNQRIQDRATLYTNDLIQIGLIKIRLHESNEIPQYSTLEIDLENNVLFRKKKKDPTFSKNFQTIKMHRDLILLHKISKLVYNYHSIDELLQVLIKEVTIELCSERGCVFLMQSSMQPKEAKHIFFSRKASGEQSMKEFELDKSILDNTIINEQGTVSTKESLLESTHSQRLKIRSTICVPLMGRSGCLGALYLDSTSTDNLFGEDELDLLTAIARQVGLALERMLLEEKLIASAKHYRSVYQSIIEHASDVIYRHDQKGNYLLVSPSVEKILGYEPKNFLENPNTWDLCVFEDDFETYYEKRSKVFEQKHCSLRYRMVHKNGKVIWVEEIRYLVIDENDTYIQGILRDVTEKMALEEQLQRAQRMEAMGLLAGGVAHDLNNILSGLLGYPDLLLMKLPPDSPLCKYLHGIKESAERASDVVNDLLALARRENYSMEPIPINRIAEDYLHSLDFQAIKNRYPNVDIDLVLDKGNTFIKGSLSHLIKSFMNLIINAMQAMPKGGELRVCLKQRSLDESFFGYEEIKPGDYGVIEIEDNGQGIASKDIKKIFEPFYSKKIHKRGTGLGLAIVYGVIHDHNGFLDIKSVEGKGTKFSVYLPETAPREKSVATASLNLRGTESVLVIDDVPEQRELAKEFLTPLGYRVHCVTSGEEAVAYLSKNYADILILDMIMEDGIDGLETYQRILKIHPNQKAIIASGFANNERVKKAQELGACSYLGKPYTRQQLSVAIRKELNRKKNKTF
ncbi:ATP-binding protein [Candidatus Uabimicrobium amorphum]|uniref:histidine kinase n=1 Tax=Uabimicrobium amorphum TaxID=2596890 RepID=A0A5S9IUI4_UABAM|nr:ATP-binding protein [Candidatus Uabimicrobium amorphum]BBM88164.1 hybrid sensor histidine kinase/responseregulator [Candidatus Uabimicrobium amorphum]